MKVIVHPEVFSIARLDPSADIPDLAGIDWYSVTRTPNELSIVAPKKYFKKLGLECEREWSCVSLDQTFDLSITGIASAFTKPLADAGVPVFIINTYDTDHIFVPKDRCDETIKLLNTVNI
jgi:uncharacterized protein